MHFTERFRLKTDSSVFVVFQKLKKQHSVVTKNANPESAHTISVHFSLQLTERSSILCR